MAKYKEGGTQFLLLKVLTMKALIILALIGAAGKKNSFDFYI